MDGNSRNPNLAIHLSKIGFELLRQEETDSPKEVFYEIQHLKTQAKWIHISSPDDNNVFVVTFRTPSKDSTGAAHILEHAVLEGSQKYPVKTFKNLSGRSLNTFLNAMTAMDYTAYPLASRNSKDFFNLIKIYLDAVFFPLLRKESFLQEGWRYEFSELENSDSDLSYKGVVYNEMKGAMADVFDVSFIKCMEALFPDLPYRYNSGGDAKDIPNLTYEQWIAFHKRYYHPSNAYVFSYGDIPAMDIAEIVEENAFKHFDFVNPAPPIPCQPTFTQPVNKFFDYPVPKTDPDSDKFFMRMVWRLCPVTDVYQNLQLRLMSEVLIGDLSSPVNRSIMESDVGGSPAPLGVVDDTFETVFGIGIKNLEKDKIQKAEEILLDALRTISEIGISSDEVLAALHQMELEHREIKGENGIPAGLYIAEQGASIWINGGDFLDAIKMNRHFERLKADASKSEFIPNLIKTYLLKNTHRATVTLRPDPGGLEKQETLTRNHLKTLLLNMNEEEKQNIITQTIDLRNKQDHKENLDCLPFIVPEDISPEPFTVPQSKLRIGGIPCFHHNVKTNGVTYFTVGFDTDLHEFNINIGSLLINSVLPKLGAAGYNPHEMEHLVNRYTGGISMRYVPYRDLESRKIRILTAMSSKCLIRNHEKMLDIISDILNNPQTDDRKRTTEMITFLKSRLEYYALNDLFNPLIYASGRGFSEFCSLQHQINGLDYFGKLHRLGEEETRLFVHQVDQFLDDVITKGNMRLSCTGSDDSLANVTPLLAGFSNRMRDHYPILDLKEPWSSSVEVVREAWIMNTGVSRIVLSYPAVNLAHPDASALLVLCQLMELPLHDRIREKGGAYGAMAIYDSEAMLFSFISFQDPHTAQTIRAFKEVIDYIGSGSYQTKDLYHAIIEIIRKLDIPPSPSEKGMVAFMNTLRNITYEFRKKLRQQILSVTKSDIDRVTARYFGNEDISNIAIMTTDEILKTSETTALNLTRIPVFDKE
ncbi:insulinase family protein [bacterium]|nr:insulinase family protein [candidate division CSSED10-310 bacterium]